MGFPVIKVTEGSDSITVRQDRFLEDGHVRPEDNETIWDVPLSLLTVDGAGKPHIDRRALLSTRETTLKVDTSKPFKLNAETTGVCEPFFLSFDYRYLC
jgi:aminopeptidase 2